jgi:hypothetical protein
MKNLVALAVVAVLLAAQPVSAQSVFVPQDGAPVQQASPPPADPQPQAAQPAPFSRPNTVGSANSVPPVVSQPGLMTGRTSPVRGMSPEQIAQARQAFEAMAAKNPQFAAINPFARQEAVEASQALQKQIAKRVREACKLKFFNVILSTELAMNKVVFQNVKGYGATTLVNAMSGVCSDEKLKQSLQESVGMFNIKHKPGVTEAIVEGGIMAMTLTYDFTLPEPPKAPAVRAQFQKALEVTADKNTVAYEEVEDIDQDELERRMEKILANP